jgi:hypothetical protein
MFQQLEVVIVLAAATVVLGAFLAVTISIQSACTSPVLGRANRQPS